MDKEVRIRRSSDNKNTWPNPFFPGYVHWIYNLRHWRLSATLSRVRMEGFANLLYLESPHMHRLLAFLPPSSPDVFVHSTPFPCLSPVQTGKTGSPFSSCSSSSFDACHHPSRSGAHTASCL